MNRRSFLTSLGVVGLLTASMTVPYAEEPKLVCILRLHADRTLERVRMQDLRKGDHFIMEGRSFVLSAVESPRPCTNENGVKTWAIQAKSIRAI